MSSSSSLPLCFDLRFFMNLMTKAIERINFVHFESLLTSIIHSSFDVSIVTFVSPLLPKEFFQWLSGSLKKVGGVNHNTLISQAGIPRETWSAELTFPLICCHLETSVLLRISCTLFAIKVFNLSLLLIQARTASLSLHTLEVTGIVSCLETNCISLHPSTAACNSSFGILICFSGATLALYASYDKPSWIGVSWSRTDV